MTNRENVILGIENCLQTDSVTECSRATCPFINCRETCLEWLLRSALALLKEQEWNALTEDADGFIHGLPGDDGQYLMTDGEEIWIDEYVDGVADGIFLDSGRDIRDITAWMYMPKLPKKNRR